MNQILSFHWHDKGDRVVGISVKVREHAVFQIWNQSVAARDQSKVLRWVGLGVE